MEFNERSEQGSIFERWVLNYLNTRKNVRIAKLIGVEHQHPDVMKELRKLNDIQALSLRYSPDGVMILEDGRLQNFEAKASNWIEKNCYLQYVEHANRFNCPVWVFVKYEAVVYIQNVTKIKFRSTKEVLANFPEEKKHFVKIIENDWMDPRDPKVKGFHDSKCIRKYFDFESFNILTEITNADLKPFEV